MFSVKYKFLAWKDEEAKLVQFDGSSISISDLKLAVAKQTSCDPNDLSFQDHATKEYYSDDAMVLKNSYLIAYRGGSRKPVPPARPVRRAPANVPPPEGYVCDRCKIPGHFKSNCPTLGDAAYDVRLAAPAGIPTSMTKPASIADGTIRLPDGSIVTLKTNADILDAAVEEKRKKEEKYESIPKEFRCSISKTLLHDPHQVPCCSSDFCAKCILPDVLTDAIKCPNCHKTIIGTTITQNTELASKVKAWVSQSNYVDSDATEPTPFNLTVPSLQTAAPVITSKRRPPPRPSSSATASTTETKDSPSSSAPSSPPVQQPINISSSNSTTSQFHNAIAFKEDTGYSKLIGESNKHMEIDKPSTVTNESERGRTLSTDHESNEKAFRDLSPASKLRQLKAKRAAAASSPEPTLPNQPTVPSDKLKTQHIDSNNNSSNDYPNKGGKNDVESSAQRANRSRSSSEKASHRSRSHHSSQLSGYPRGSNDFKNPEDSKSQNRYGDGGRHHQHDSRTHKKRFREDSPRLYRDDSPPRKSHKGRYDDEPYGGRHQRR